MSSHLDTQKLLDANAIVTTLHSEGVRGVLSLFDEDEAYADPTTLLVSLTILKNLIDSIMPFLPDEHALTWRQMLSANAEMFTAHVSS